MPSLSPKPDSALLLLGHGSTENSDSSLAVHRHADTIRRRGLFAQVHTAFWKEQPSFAESLWGIDAGEIYVVPVFISDGWFTRSVIPRELGLSGPTTDIERHRVHLCAPVGSHPSMTDRLLERAERLTTGIDRSEVAVVIVGHGTPRDANSAAAVRTQVERLRARDTGFAEIHAAWMEEAPVVADWEKWSHAAHVVVVPFFISDGLHTIDDIPRLLGVGREVVDEPVRVRDRTLHYGRALGTDAGIAEVILDQVQAFDEAQPLRDCRCAESAAGRQPASASENGLREAFLRWLADLPSAGTVIGEVLLRELPPTADPACSPLNPDTARLANFELLHHRDAETPSNELDTRIGASVGDYLRCIALHDADGGYRPLKTQPDLRSRWRVLLHTPSEVRQALDAIYPGAFAAWHRHSLGSLRPVGLDESLRRQGGRLADAIAGLPAADRRKVVDRVCDYGCLKRRLWTCAGLNSASIESVGDGGFPLLCAEACPWLLGRMADA